MRIEQNYNWIEITEEEYNKHIVVIPKNATYIQTFEAVFNHYPKEIVKREIIVPDNICGIFSVMDYIYSNEPKKYTYYKSIGKRTDYIVSSTEYEELKDNPFFESSQQSTPSPKK